MSSLVAGCSLIIFAHLAINFINSPLLATSGLFVPFTTMPFNFLEPKTAPIPVLAACLSSKSMPLILLRFSPAGPITAVLTLPYFSFNFFCVSLVVIPHNSSPFSIETSSSSIFSITGLLLFPSTTRREYPALRSSTPIGAPTTLLPNPPVRGDLDARAVLLAVGIPNPVRAPGAMKTLFSSPSGSAPLGTSW